jgi:MFS family permease
MVVVAMASGFVLGGFGVDWAVRRDRRWYVWGPSICLALATPLFLIGLAQPTLLGTMSMLLVAHAALFVFYTPTLAIAQNMVDASMRASSAFAAAVVLGLVGAGLGPTLVGILSDVAANRYFTAGNFNVMCPGGSALPGSESTIAQACGSASAKGITFAIGAIVCLLLWASIHFWLAARDLRIDLDTRYQPKPSPKQQNASFPTEA